MKILVGIANYGVGNRKYLEQLLQEYRSMSFDVHTVVLSNIPKDLGPDVEVRVGLPSKDPWSLPFAHRDLFAERMGEYDLFIYSEDDTLVRQSHIRAFLEVSEMLKEDEVAGFLRTEEDPSGVRYCSSVHSFFRWDLGSLCRRGDLLCARFTNEHAACCMLTRDQLRRAVESGGFSVAPHQGRHDMLCAAATDAYTQCGLTRLLCISRLEEFLLPHLPNKYLGRFGITLEELRFQVQILERLQGGNGWRGPLFTPESRLPRCRWSKNLYESPSPGILDLVPPTARRVLSVGCGWGASEGELLRRGHEVVALPVDPVLGARAAARGVRIMEGPFSAAVDLVRKEQWDCILLANVLHLTPDPKAWLAALLESARVDTRVLIANPNIGPARLRLEARKGSDCASAGESTIGGVSITTPSKVSHWLKSIGWQVERIEREVPRKRGVWNRATLGLFRDLLATGFALLAIKRIERTA